MSTQARQVPTPKRLLLSQGHLAGRYRTQYQTPSKAPLLHPFFISSVLWPRIGIRNLLAPYNTYPPSLPVLTSLPTTGNLNREERTEANPGDKRERDEKKRKERRKKKMTTLLPRSRIRELRDLVTAPLSQIDYLSQFPVLDVERYIDRSVASRQETENFLDAEAFKANNNNNNNNVSSSSSSPPTLSSSSYNNKHNKNENGKQSKSKTNTKKSLAGAPVHLLYAKAVAYRARALIGDDFCPMSMAVVVCESWKRESDEVKHRFHDWCYLELQLDVNALVVDNWVEGLGEREGWEEELLPSLSGLSLEGEDEKEGEEGERKEEREGGESRVNGKKKNEREKKKGRFTREEKGKWKEGTAGPKSGAQSRYDETETETGIDDGDETDNDDDDKTVKPSQIARPVDSAKVRDIDSDDPLGILTTYGRRGTFDYAAGVRFADRIPSVSGPPSIPGYEMDVEVLARAIKTMSWLV